jgi:hypothetical protein
MTGETLYLDGSYPMMGICASGVTMITRPWLWALALPAAVICFAAQVQAIELNGLWASDPALCDKIFTKKGKQVVFSPLSDLYGSGFIIDGNRIRGKVARCTIKSRKQDGDTLLLSATCSTIIAAQELEFSLKTIDDNTVSRLFPGSSAMRVDFHRCPQ